MDKALLSEIFTLPVEEVWPRLFGWAWSVFSEPIGAGAVDSVLGQRDRRIAPLDNLLSGSAWELWDAFEATAPRTVASLEAFWATRTGGKAILILDALSLREVPWLLEQAQARGYPLHEARATASEAEIASRADCREVTTSPAWTMVQKAFTTLNSSCKRTASFSMRKAWLWFPIASTVALSRPPL